MIQLTINPATINAGGTATLSWTVTNATSVSIDHGVGTVGLTGTKIVTPTASTTYKLSASNAAGAAIKTVSVIVNAAGSHPRLPSNKAQIILVRVLGVDPGTLNMGYGVIEESGGQVVMLTCGVLSAPQKMPVEERLCSLYEGLLKIIVEFKPDELAVEEPFMANNARLGAGDRPGPGSCHTGGRTGKIARFTLYAHAGQTACHELWQEQQRPGAAGGQAPAGSHVDLPEASDAADALAVAICHLNQRHLNEILKRGY